MSKIIPVGGAPAHPKRHPVGASEHVTGRRCAGISTSKLVKI